MTNQWLRRKMMGEGHKEDEDEYGEGEDRMGKRTEREELEPWPRVTSSNEGPRRPALKLNAQAHERPRGATLALTHVCTSDSLANCLKPLPKMVAKVTVCLPAPWPPSTLVEHAWDSRGVPPRPPMPTQIVDASRIPTNPS